MSVDGTDDANLENIISDLEKKQEEILTEEEIQSNARLIAAAPEMLEVLIDEYKNMCNYCNEGCVNKEKIWKCGVKIKDIIEKATGLKIEEVLKCTE